MIQKLKTYQQTDAAFRSTVSRREMLQGLATTAIAATGLSSARTVLANDGRAITPFSYHAPKSALDDLKQRLTQTRWPDRETVTDWSQGVPLSKLRALVEYWRTGYDWRRFEAGLNSLAQFRTPQSPASLQRPMQCLRMIPNKARAQSLHHLYSTRLDIS